MPVPTLVRGRLAVCGHCVLWGGLPRAQPFMPVHTLVQGRLALHEHRVLWCGHPSALPTHRYRRPARVSTHSGSGSGLNGMSTSCTPCAFELLSSES